jgi:hypothetical protein
MKQNNPTTPPHPIVPSQELLKQWEDDWCRGRKTFINVLIQAFQAGADQELEECIEWMKRMGYWGDDGKAIPALLAARRPKPPSLKEQALVDFDWLIGRTLGRPEFDERSERILRALEQLPDRE